MAAAKNLAEGGSEAFRALLNSIVPDTDKNLSPEAIQRLSQKVSDLVGGEEQAQNILNGIQGGELVNEDGLPIVDISEQATDEPSQNEALEDSELIHPSKLSPAQLEVRRRERDRILALLEAEEEEEERRQDEDESERKREALAKRQEVARMEAERLAAAKAMQKKMGKALLKGLGESRPKETESKATPKDAEPSNVMSKPPGPQKSVSFVEPSEPSVKQKESSVDWGDVSQGRLISSKRPTLLSQLKTDETLPMKLSVVERIPGVPEPPSLPPPSHSQDYIDSDDESDFKPPSSDDDDSEVDADDEVEDGTDFDYAEHQREIALDYHSKRAKIGQEVAQAMRSHSHAEDVDDMPIPPTRSSLSRFKSERLASSYNAASPSTSQSLGTAAVLPASGAETLRSAIRMGKLDEENRLVAGEESDGSDNELQEIFDLIKKGEIYNAGPFGPPVKQTTQPEAGPSSTTSTLGDIPPLPPKPKTSRFKASRPQVPRIPQSPLSESPTPLTTAARSSPKLSEFEPPSFLSSSLSFKPGVAAESSTPRFNLPADIDPMYMPSGNPMSMIVESPSFPMSAVSAPAPSSRPVMSSSVGERKPTAVMSSGVVERSSRPERPPVVMSSSVMERNTSRSQRPPTIVSASVVEKKKSY
ncbi:hypothetical protein BDZ89DRAFT_1170234 [Hymenopellis radicata]|nr:hypothetical protein BDZ89DRAFT_1170234 [Hymenopellis radicata]